MSMLMVYMGLSLSIIRWALHVSGCMRTYAYTAITLVHGHASYVDLPEKCPDMPI